MAKRQPVRAFKVYRKGYIIEVRIYRVPASKKNPLVTAFAALWWRPGPERRLSATTITGRKALTGTFTGERNPIRFKTWRRFSMTLNVTVNIS
jgi:predicted transcriptional regulator